MKQANQTSRAFTLVELLVVVATVAILVAMLLPAMRKARQAALSVSCLSNLRQAGIGFQIYAAENNQFIPIYRSNNGNVRMWAWFLSYGVNSHDQPGKKVFVDRKVSLCPASDFYDRDLLSVNAGSASTGQANASYAAYWICSNSNWKFRSSSLERTVVIRTTPWWGITLHKLTSLPSSPSTAVLLGDSISNHGSSLGGGWHMIGAFTDYSPNLGGGNIPEYNGRLYLQHGDRCNVMFYDGHAESLTNRQLYYETAQQIRQVMDGNRKVLTLP